MASHIALAIETSRNMESVLREKTASLQLEALKESEERLRLLVGNAPLLLFALDEKGKLTFAEGKSLKDLGLSSGEIMGKTMPEVMSDRPRPLPRPLPRRSTARIYQRNFDADISSLSFTSVTCLRRD